MFNCPTCKKPVSAETIGQKGSTFPFCCDRCRLIDLGRWASGAYQIQAEPSDDEADETPPDVWVDPEARRKR